MLAERHPSLSLGVLQAENSVCPGTQAWSLPANITGGQPWLSPTCPGASGLARGPEGLAEPPCRRLHPQVSRLPSLRGWLGLTRSRRQTPAPGKYWQGRSKSPCVLAGQPAHSPGVHRTPDPHVVTSQQLAQEVRRQSPPQSLKTAPHFSTDPRGKFPKPRLPPAAQASHFLEMTTCQFQKLRGLPRYGVWRRGYHLIRPLPYQSCLLSL